MQLPPSLTLYAPEDFPKLRALVQAQGLMEKRKDHFVLHSVLAGLGLVGSVWILYATDLWWVQIFNAMLLACSTVQIGFLVHDGGHRQIFEKGWKNNIVAYAGMLLAGASAGWWIEKHNEHHAHPNREDMDPDIDIPLLAFTPEQAQEKRGICRWIVRRQHYFFFVILTLVSVSMRQASIRYILRNPLRRTWADIAGLAAFVILYLGIVFTALTPATGILFILVHQALQGFYLGSVFAPNHKGMPILKKEDKVDFLREQVLTSRNVRSGFLVDFMYGGLNYQVEHHLFPTMPRANLKKANRIVKEFCKEKNIPFHETGVIQSYREMLQSMRQVAQFA